jgi:hypothetical protein
MIPVEYNAGGPRRQLRAYSPAHIAMKLPIGIREQKQLFGDVFEALQPAQHALLLVRAPPAEGQIDQLTMSIRPLCPPPIDGWPPRPHTRVSRPGL